MKTVRSERHQQEEVEQVYEFAADLLVNKKMTGLEVRNLLMQQGVDEVNALVVVENLENYMHEIKIGAANKNMLQGALWCIGGIAATAADIGFIFWGAIVFGAIQFCRGVASSV